MKNENQNSNGASSIYNEKNKMHDDFDDDDESNSQDYNDDSNMMDTTGYQPSPNISKTIKPFNQSNLKFNFWSIFINNQQFFPILKALIFPLKGKSLVKKYAKSVTVSRVTIYFRVIIEKRYAIQTLL
jgi:hypothetical protein